VDQSLPKRAQADLTCPDARNVRGFPASAGAQTVGGRDGTAKAFINAAGGTTGVTITGLEVAVRAFNTSPTTIGTYQFVTDSFSDYSFPTAYNGYTIGQELRGRYLRFSRSLTQWGATGWQGTASPPQTSITLVRGGGFPDHLSALSNFADGYGLGLAVTEDTQNDVSITLNCYRRARSIDFVDCTNIGPFVRGHANLSGFVWAYLQRQGDDNSVKLVIVSVIGDDETQLAAGETTSLSGSSTISNNCTIRLQATSAGLTATWKWPDENIDQTVGVSSTVGVKTAHVKYNTLGGTGAFVLGDPITLGVSTATGVVLEDVYDGGTDGFLSIYVTSGTFAAGSLTTASGSGTTATALSEIETRDNARGGWFFKSPATSVPGGEPGYFRRVSNMQFAKLVPPVPEVVAEIYGTTEFSGAGRYLLPPNWEAYDLDVAQAGAGLYRVVAGQTGYSTNTASRVPLVDSTERVILGPNTTRLTRSGLLTIEVWGTTPPTEHYDVEVRLRDIDGTVDDGIGAVFCMEDFY
jgi:hypothetical protein